MQKILALLLVSSSFLFAQHIVTINGIPRDTSYTLYSANKKMLKKFPDAKLVTKHLPVNLKEESNIIYAKIGERELHLNVFYPADANVKTYPGVLMIYGGGWASGDTSLIIPMAERLAAKEFVTVTPE